MIVVVGGGAIGLLVAASLARAGNPVGLLGRGAAVAALREGPLSLTVQGRRQTIAGIEAAERPEELAARGPIELAILAVKAYDTVGALPALDGLRPQAVLTLQNGIGNEDLLAAHLGADRVLAGAITSSTVVEGPAAITVTKAGGIGLAQVGGAAPLASWAARLREAGWSLREYADYRPLKWSKALLNMLGNASSAILDMPPDAIYAHRGLFELEMAAQREALAVMERQDWVPVNLPSYPAATLVWAEQTLPAPILQPLLRKLVGGGRGGKMPSLHGDLARGRTRSEGEQLYGAVAAEAGRLGIPAPANQKLWGTLQRIISGEIPWEHYKGQPEALLRASEAHG
jgi:2-dehydropantoate 2-reductase